MKKRYVAPKLEVEIYEINTAVASCADKVTVGPQIGTHDACDGWEDIFEDEPIATQAAELTSFYNDGTCDCYYSAGNQGYFTS